MKATAATIALALALGAAACGGSEPEPPAPQLDPVADHSIDIGGTPFAVTVGDREVWVADFSGSKLVGISSGSGTEFRRGGAFDVAAGPVAVAADDDDGDVWAASGDGTITRLDPVEGEVTEVAKVSQPGGIAVGEGAIWVTSGDRNVVARLDPVTGDPIDEIDVGELPADVAVGDGAAWVANTNDGTVTRIDAASGEADAPIGVASQQVLALALGEGGVWVAGTDDERGERIEVSRIDPESGELGEDATEVEAGIPIDLAAGEGGVWATLVGSPALPGEERSGRVAVLDPATGELEGEPIEVGDRPGGVAVGEGYVWVANADGTVTQIDPGAESE